MWRKLSRLFRRTPEEEEEYEEDEAAGVEFLARRMKMKLSMYKCLDCERRSKGLPFLFHRVRRGNKCPVCRSSRVRKISVSAVIKLRWNRSVKKRLETLRAPSLYQNT